MNTIWSKYVQGTKTLYYSRKLRFDDLFSEQYRNLFGLDAKQQLKILEIGCGPGALAGALHRWYPLAEITAVDRDSEFIRFGTENEPGVNFVEGDATALPFEDNTFDVTTEMDIFTQRMTLDMLCPNIFLTSVKLNERLNSQKMIW